MTHSSITVRQTVSLAVSLLVLVLAAHTAQAQVFVGADAGVSVLSQEDHAPPICCGERDSWSSPGGRVGGRLGYSIGWFFVRADAGVAVHRVNAGDDMQLRLVSPDLALMLGAQARHEKLTVDFALGAGKRWFSGSAISSRPNSSDWEIDKSAPDLRISFGVHRTLAGGHRLGADFSLAKVMIAQNVVMLSLVYSWAVQG